MALWPFGQGKKKTEQSSTGTVEELLAQVDALSESNLTDTPERFRVWVMSNLKWQQQPIVQDMAMAIVLDALLGKDFMPDGFTECNGGRWYEYIREPST